MVSKMDDTYFKKYDFLNQINNFSMPSGGPVIQYRYITKHFHLETICLVNKITIWIKKNKLLCLIFNSFVQF